MSGLETLSPQGLVLVSILASLTINLALLGMVLGRGDRQTVTLVQRSDQERRNEIKRLSHRLEESEERHRIQMHDLRRAMARLELRKAGRLARESEAEAPLRTSNKAIDRKHQVYRLARRGIGPQGIARRLNIYQGEAELLLGLKGLMGAKETAPEKAPPVRLH